MLRQKERKSNAGRKPFDVVVMFKILILQSLYNLSDDQTEFQIRDRLSFMRFLGLTLGGRVPDAKTIWLFRDQLTEAGLVRTVFAQFDQFLRAHGFAAQKGQIVDASIVQAPRQRNRGDVWADSAYRSQEKLAALSEQGYRPHLQRKGCRHRRLTESEKRGNHTRSKIRSRVEHVFGVQTQRAGTLILRSIGRIRARIIWPTIRIGMRC